MVNKMNTKLIHRTAPLSLPIIVYIVCFLAIFLTGNRPNLHYDIKRAFRYGIEGVFYVPLILGVIVAMFDWLLQAYKKFVATIFYLALAVSITWGWIVGYGTANF